MTTIYIPKSNSVTLTCENKLYTLDKFNRFIQEKGDKLEKTFSHRYGKSFRHITDIDLPILMEQLKETDPERELYFVDNYFGVCLGRYQPGLERAMNVTRVVVERFMVPFGLSGMAFFRKHKREIDDLLEPLESVCREFYIPSVDSIAIINQNRKIPIVEKYTSAFELIPGDLLTMENVHAINKIQKPLYRVKLILNEGEMECIPFDITNVLNSGNRITLNNVSIRMIPEYI